MRSLHDSMIVTVQGEITSERLGCTLVHEHLHADMTPLLGVHDYEPDEGRVLDWSSIAEARWSPGAYPDNYRLTDVDLIVAELAPLFEAGGRAVVDATPAGLGRSPEALREISLRSGLHVVMGSGYYLEPAHPPRLALRSSEELAEELVGEARDGVGEGGVRPGILGEIGTGPRMTAAEGKVLRAAAWARGETGLALSVHLHPWAKEGLAVLAVLEHEGVKPSKIILNHLTTAVADDAYQRALLERGVYLAYDLFGFDHSCLVSGRYPPSDFDVALKVAQLISAGHLHQLLISQDVGVKTRLRAYGGWGYSHLLEHIVPLLRGHGLGEAEINTLLVENPRRVLAVDC